MKGLAALLAAVVLAAPAAGQTRSPSEAAAPEALERGRAILAAAQRAVGGVERLRSLRDASADVIGKNGKHVRVWIEAASGLPLKKAYRGIGIGGQAEMEHTFSDYREVDGVRVPFRIEITQKGFPFITAKLTTVEFNTGVNLIDLAKKPE